MLFHPYLVHFPIAFFFLEAFLIFLWFKKKDDRYEEFGFFILKLALATMPFVMLAGYIDAGGIHPKVRLHFISAVSLFFLNGCRLLFRLKGGRNIWQGSTAKTALALLVLNILLTGTTAHLGGLMVYE